MNEKERLKEILSVLKDSNILSGVTPEKVYDIISKLGPTFIKLGQIMSNRYDILPKEYCDILAKLRSDVNPMNFLDVKEILEEELQMKCFYCFRYIRPLYEDELETNCCLTYLFAIFCFRTVSFHFDYLGKYIFLNFNVLLFVFTLQFSTFLL